MSQSKTPLLQEDRDDLSPLSRDLLAGAPIPIPPQLAEKVFHFEGFNYLRHSVRKPELGESFFDRILAALNISYDCPQEAFKRIPRTGPVIVVANHPFGLLEGPVLGGAFLRLRPDVKFMANSLLHVIPEMRDWVIGVDPFGNAQGRNLKPMRESLQWLKKGGLLIIFPAGEVSTLQLPQMRIADPEWNEMIVRLVKHSGAQVVPVHFRGTNGPLFHAAGFVHPRLRTALLPREFFKSSGNKVEFRIGSPIPVSKLESFEHDKDALEYLRRRVYVMESQHQDMAVKLPMPLPRWQPAPEPLADPEDPAAIQAEFANLPPAQMLYQHNEYQVYVAHASQIPCALREIGRLRELTFREVGEGTNKARDLDPFDDYYEHLILFHQGKGEIAGGYRFLRTDEASKRGGISALYTSTLFRLQPEFLDRIGPALELGRSFVRLEYQRSYQPLMLLWKGFGQYLIQNPRYCQLFGPVSISAEYSRTCREIMVSYLSHHRNAPELGQFVKPRHPFRVNPFNRDLRLLTESITSVEEFADIVSDADPHLRSVPVLLRHYLNLGGRIANFNVDPDFNNALDGLILVDVRQTEPRVLERYMGKQGAESFLSFHRS